MSWIRVVGLLHVMHRRLLLTRSKGKDGFYLPGGTLNPGESELDALRREIREELGCELSADTAPYRTYVAQAFGEPDGVLVEMAVYRGSLVGDPRPAAEIAKVRYFSSADYNQMPRKAPAVEEVLRDLKADGLVD